MNTRKLSAALVAVLMALVLTGCGGASSQTVEEACEIAKTETQALDESAADLKPADIVKEFKRISGKISNSEVKQVYVDIADAFEKFGELEDQTEGAIDAPELSDDALETFEKLESAGARLAELCGLD